MENTWNSLFRAARQFSANRSGNMAILFAFMALPLTLLMGLGIDYFRGLSVQARLNQASDAAAIAAVNTAVNYVKTNSTNLSGSALTNAAIAAGEAQGAKAFNANMGAVADEVKTAVVPNVVVQTTTSTANGQTVNAFSATVSYSTSYVMAFGPLVGSSSFAVTGQSASTALYPLYLDLHIVIDNSESMGIGASDADQQAMTNAIGCTVACHYPWGSYPQGTWVPIRNMSPAPTLRIDVIRNAVVSELQKIKNLTFPGQIRIALYTFSTKLTTVYALNQNIDGAITAAGTIDIATDSDDGGTYSSYALQSLLPNLPTPGDGTNSASRLGDVLFFTDGIQNSSTKFWPNGNDLWDQYGCNTTAYPNFYPPASGTTYFCEYGVVEGFDPSYCQPIKDKKYQMYTLDFQYYISQAAYNSDTRYQEIQNVFKPQILQNMKTCSSEPNNPNYATQATTSAEFVTALDTLVNQVLANVRLTQ